jgi:hypothetical protein
MRPVPTQRPRFFAFLAVCLLVGTAISSFAPGAFAQAPGEDYDIVKELNEAFQTEAGQKFTEQFTAGEAKVFTDPEGDFIHPRGPEPGFTPPYVDISEVVKTGRVFPGKDTTEFDRFFSSGPNGGPWCDKSGFGSNPDIQTVCSDDWDGKPTQYDDGALVVGAKVEASIPRETPSGGCEIGFWTYTPSFGPAFKHSADFPKDPADGMNAGLIMRGTAQGNWSMANYRLGASGQFERQPSDAVAAIYQDQVAVIRPLDEVGDLTKAQYHVFCANGERTDPKVSGGDILGPVDVDLDSLASLTFTGVAPASPAESPAPSAQTEGPAALAPVGESDRTAMWGLVIALGAALFLLGVFFFLRSRGRDEAM